jgi:hypothetical protein
MAISKEERLLKLFHQLPETAQNSTLDFMEYLAERKKQTELEMFYTTLPEVNEPFSEEEVEQMKDPEFISWEEACQELGWDDENQPKSECD